VPGQGSTPPNVLVVAGIEQEGNRGVPAQAAEAIACDVATSHELLAIKPSGAAQLPGGVPKDAKVTALIVLPGPQLSGKALGSSAKPQVTVQGTSKNESRSVVGGCGYNSQTQHMASRT
jgi:hypothetical protein